MSNNPFDDPGDDASQQNPFAAPANPFDVSSAAVTQAEAIRREHLSHEASIKAMGVLFILGGVLGTLYPVALLTTVQGVPNAFFIGIMVLVACVAMFQLAVGIALRRLAPWARIAGAVLAGFGLLAFPIGTLINGYFLYLLLSAKGNMVFSPEYKKIIEATPHVKYKTSIVVWILLILLLLVLALAITAAVVGGAR